MNAHHSSVCGLTDTRRPAGRRGFHLAAGGFTLVEMLICMLVLGIVLLGALPALNSSLQAARLSAAVDEIVAAFSFAELKAMGSGRETRVTIDDATETILVEQFIEAANFAGAEGQLAAGDVEGGAFEPLALPMNPGVDYHLDLADQGRFDGVNILTATFGSDDYVTFDRLGKPDRRGEITVTCGDRQVLVVLRKTNGKINIFD